MLYKLVNGRYRKATVQDISQAYAKQIRPKPRTAFTSPFHTREYLKAKLEHKEREYFGCLFLDNRNRLISDEILFAGTIDGASVHPREVAKSALKHNAAGIILYHNHPSGISEPSQADEIITHRLRDGLGLLDIRVLDHIIIGSDDDSVSFADRGLI